MNFFLSYHSRMSTLKYGRIDHMIIHTIKCPKTWLITVDYFQNKFNLKRKCNKNKLNVLQIVWMWCCTWRMHPNLRAVLVLGDTVGTGNADRPGLCARWKWLRLQTKVRNWRFTRTKHNTVVKWMVL